MRVVWKGHEKCAQIATVKRDRAASFAERPASISLRSHHRHDVLSVRHLGPRGVAHSKRERVVPADNVALAVRIDQSEVVHRWV